MKPSDAGALAARASPAGLGLYDRGDSFQFPPHLQVLDRALCDVAAGRCKRLIVEMPPRHGKSQEVSEYFPACLIGGRPDKRVMLASYGADLASDFGARARDLLIKHGPELFGVTVNPRKSAANDWGILGHQGGMVTAGVGGPFTGKGADVMIIDDPVKNHEEAQSKTHREKVWNWYTSTAYTRLEPDGAMIIIQTRWHEDDLAGRAQQQEDEGWRVIRMPAICDDEATDPIGRKLGEALWPRRYSADLLATIGKSVGTFVWNALYQQRPVAPAGNVVKRSWFKFYTELPEGMDRQSQSWDLTFKDSEGADFVAGHVWGERGADSFLLDRTHAKMDYPTTKTAIRAMTSRWPDAHEKLVEDKANGPAIMAELGREITGLIAVEPQGGKMARLIASSPQIESGNVWLPDPSIAPWVKDFIDEVCAFPNAKHDDDVDAMTQHLVRKLTRIVPRFRSLAA